jgi:hypothetical protein
VEKAHSDSAYRTDLSDAASVDSTKDSKSSGKKSGSGSVSGSADSAGDDGAEVAGELGEEERKFESEISFIVDNFSEPSSFVRFVLYDLKPIGLPVFILIIFVILLFFVLFQHLSIFDTFFSVFSAGYARRRTISRSLSAAKKYAANGDANGVQNAIRNFFSALYGVDSSLVTEIFISEKLSSCGWKQERIDRFLSYFGQLAGHGFSGASTGTRSDASVRKALGETEYWLEMLDEIRKRN